VAKALLKRIDRSNTYHCEMRFDTSEELAEHKASCMLRPLLCVNDGCSDVFSALHADAHDASCLFKLLPCKLNCEAMVARGEMEKHTLTICPRKMVICSFQPVGCLRTMEQVSSDFLKAQDLCTHGVSKLFRSSFSCELFVLGCHSC
jgi:homogentisate solanesyltransferase